MRFFNTTGPCDPARHFMLAPGARLPDLQPFITRQQYFVLHAPRQTGKTTAMRAFAAELRAQGLAACWVTIEASQGVEDPAEAEPLWLRALHRAGAALPADQRPPDPRAFDAEPTGDRLAAYLRAWAGALSVPLVLLIDEADVVVGPALISFLRQLRDGFMDRAVGAFPTSVALVGMRDLRDYLTQAKGGHAPNPGSPFNIKAASITLRNFSPAEVEQLLHQHTEETGQPFAPDATAELARVTDGQPFLVNALADLCVTTLVPDRAQPVTRAQVAEARERLILARTTHLDSLAQRLREPRVAQIVQAVVLGDDPMAIPYDTDDTQYVLDLGLLRRGPDGLEAANPIYREVLVRQLSLSLQSAIPRPTWPWATPEGRLDMPALLEAFRQWWRENADIAVRPIPEYPEAVPHLALCGFLQRVINGGGRVHREFAAGRGAMDLLVEFGPDRFAIELKRLRSRDRLEVVVARGVAQLGRYLDTVGLDHGWLVVFDVRPDQPWEARLWTATHEVDGKRVVVLGA
ncbi:MAG: hypothetical protein RL071_4476 [Pseudomonadota bacterium]|jgi:hypothetical protein